MLFCQTDTVMDAVLALTTCACDIIPKTFGRMFALHHQLGCWVCPQTISHVTACYVMQVLRHKIMKLPSRAETEAELQKVQSEIANIQQDIASHQHTYEVGASVASPTYLNMPASQAALYQVIESRCMCVHKCWQRLKLHTDHLTLSCCRLPPRW